MTVVPYKNVKRPIVPVGDLPMLALFARGEQGAWYDPSDLATMFQDAAGTIPVTGVEQPVGLILDKSGNGNHASQITTTARPMLSARVNNMIDSERFDAWSSAGATAMRVESVLAPDGVSVAMKMQAILGDGGHFIRKGNIGAGVGGPICRSVYLKRGTARYVWISTYTNATPNNSVTATFDFDAGAFVNVGGSTNSASVEEVGDGWYRISYYSSIEAGVYNQFGIGFSDPAASTTYGYTADGTQTVYIWGAQHEVGPKATKYQRVNTATDYDWQGWPLYLRFDGVDDNMTSLDKPITFSGDCYFAFAGGKGVEATSALFTFGSPAANRMGIRNSTVGRLVAVYTLDGVSYVVSGTNRVASLGEDHAIDLQFEIGMTTFTVDGVTVEARENSVTPDLSLTAGMVMARELGKLYSGVAVDRAITATERAAVLKIHSDKLKVPA